MGLKQFKKSIEETVVNPALAKQAGLKSGIIMSARYAMDTQMSTYNNGGEVVLDIVLYDTSGDDSQMVKEVPLVKIPGVNISLPPMGSTAVIAFLDGEESRPICIGILPNQITNEYTKDHLSPRIPPKKMSK
jgi:hypothetical protein